MLSSNNTLTMEVKRKGRKPINDLAFKKIKDAGKKEIHISAKEWKLVTLPGAYILRQYLKAEYKVQTTIDDKGWVIKKV